MSYLKDLGAIGLEYTGYRLYKAGEAIGKVTDIPAKAAWALLFAQAVIPAVNSTFLHNDFISNFHIDNHVLTNIDIAAGSIAGLNTVSRVTKKGIERAFTRRGY